jgi:hypothetical protein
VYRYHEVFRADIAHGASDEVIKGIMLQKAIDHNRPTHGLELGKFSFFVRFTVTVTGDVDCAHATPTMVEQYIAVASEAAGHKVGGGVAASGNLYA